MTDKRKILFLSILLALSACGGVDSNPTSSETQTELNEAEAHDASYDRMLQDVGGFKALYAVLMQHDKSEAIALHKKHGVNLFIDGRRAGVENSDRSVKDIFSCPSLFFPYEAGVHAYGPHFARIDGYGRPDAAAIDLKATQTNAPVLPVLSNCNLLVRNLADNLTTYRRDRNDFPASLAGLKGWNAGHLVARSMGGWNQRANLVPMLGAINKSFASLEKAALQCRSDPLIVSALYEVHALYPGDYASKYDNWGVDHAFNEVREIGVPYGLSVTLTGSKQIGAQNVPFSPSIEFNLLPEFWFHNTDAIIDHFHPLERQKLDAMRTVIRSICSDGNSPTVVDVQDIPDVEYGELGNIVDGYFRSFAEYFSQIFGGEESQ